jgi:hypothetical protein
MSSKKSSRTNGRLNLSIGLLLAVGMGGCVDYVERRDTITLRAGDAQAWNKTIHVADPWPPYAMNTQIPGDGQRTAVVIQRYSTGAGDAGSAPSTGAAGSPGAAQ